MKPPDKELARALSARMEAIGAEGERAQDELRELERRVEAQRGTLSALAAEYRELRQLYERYSNGAKHDVPAPPATGERIGPTDFILTTLGTTGTMKKRDLIALLARAIEAQQIATVTKDPQKLASSLVGNLAKRDRLMISPDGMVTLPQRNGAPHDK